MNGPYFRDDQVTLWLGDALAVLREMPDASVDCCVTSPPYFGLRDYGVEGQYGLESSPAEYVETMRALFAEVRRVLTDDGTLWLNIGDSYYSGRGNPGPNSADEKQVARRGWVRPQDRCGVAWSSPKNLLGIPWRVAFALQDDGWTLRNDIIWAKPNGLPESVADRMAKTHEYVFMLSKNRTYHFDLDAVREPHAEKSVYQQEVARRAAHNPGKAAGAPGQARQTSMAAGLRELNSKGKNPGTVWTLAPQPFTEAHFAVMPQALAERSILAGCKPGGTVLDPFSGSGTTGYAANKHGRKYVGIDLNADYLDLSLRTRFAQPGLDFGEVTA